ncbi:hypothetical protein ONZ45_g17905 [Pleurotus djamor]|nr:hypothetical protein ONZ45_g17905 [Pleurotus djamor]
MKTTCFFNLVLVLTSTAFFTPFVAGFNATSDAVEGSEAVSDVGVSAFQEMVDAGNCKNRGERLNYVVGNCDPANSKGFFSAHNCKRRGGKYYYCVSKTGQPGECGAIRWATGAENGECF